jgi:alkanesulfonate monooxygenase SsuD/methylene tetrahydromethanopterin reductase-like flavin-dependent oxidoreductase (luciferase family)
MSYYGRHYRIHNAYCEPKPSPIPPIMIGGSGRKTLRVTAQHANWWNDSAKTPELYQERLNILHEHCDYLGRHPQDIRLTWLGKLSIGQDSHATLQGSVDEIIEQIIPFVDLGIDYFIFEMNQLQDPDAVSVLVNEVLPQIRALKA